MPTHRLSLLLAAVALPTLFPAAHAAECRFERNLPVSGAQGSLDATTGSGDLKVVAGEGNRVHVTGRVRASSGLFGGGSQADVQRVCDKPPIEQAGNSIRIGHTHEDWLHSVSIDYAIEVPRSFLVTANSGSGGVELGGLTGEVSGHSGSGDIHASQLSGGAKLETSSGSIEADTLGGNVRLGTASGNIQARLDHSGEVRATSSSGEIRLEGVHSPLTAHSSSGSVEVTGTPVSFWQVGTASGDVRLHITHGSGFRLEAHTASGDVQSGLPLISEGGAGEHHLAGVVAGGGADVRVETASGSIHIE